MGHCRLLSPSLAVVCSRQLVLQQKHHVCPEDRSSIAAQQWAATGEGDGYPKADFPSTQIC